MDHNELLQQIREILDRRFGLIEQKLDRHDHKLDDHLERIAHIETQVENTRSKVHWLYGILSAIVLGVASWVKELFTT